MAFKVGGKLYELAGHVPLQKAKGPDGERTGPRSINPFPFKIKRSDRPAVAETPRPRGPAPKHADTALQSEIANHASLRSQAVDLSNRALTAFPPSLASLSDLCRLDLSSNMLHRFPAQELLAMTHLQSVCMSVNVEGAPLPRRSPGAFGDAGFQMTFVPQGNNKVSLATLPASGQKALFTTDLDPCLAVMIFQPGHALMMHVDHAGAGGIGGTSVAEVLKRHVSAGAAGTQVHLIGCNAQNSAGQLRGVLSALNELGLTDSIVMASIGNGHSSAVMDLTNRKAFVGFG